MEEHDPHLEQFLVLDGDALAAVFVVVVLVLACHLRTTGMCAIYGQRHVCAICDERGGMKGTGEGTYLEQNARRAFREPHFEWALESVPERALPFFNGTCVAAALV